MTDKISRREFLKLSGASIAAAAALTGCGPAARYVNRRPYADMPEYNQTGISTSYATTCRECPAGCGLIVRTLEGRAIKIEGNPNHPVNRGRICPRGLTAVQGLYNPDRITAPRQNDVRGGATYRELDWEAAIQVLQEALTQNKPDEIAFLLGLTPDHLFDLVSEIAAALGAPPPLRYGALGMFESRATLVEAVRSVFGRPALPYFDVARAEFILSFGANFLETWLSPVTYSRAYGHMRQGNSGRRGHLVSFEPRQSLTSANADEWYALNPGSDGVVALALAGLVARIRGVSLPPTVQPVDPAVAAEIAGIQEEKLLELAERFAGAAHPLAIPGGNALAHHNGLENARAILALNVIADNLGKPGGAYLAANEANVSTINDVGALIQRMQDGKIKALFVHGINPAFELPAALGFDAALQQVPLVISFASFEDETAVLSDYVLPDHTGLESWGYQRTLPGADRMTYAAFQPVIAPLYRTQATADVLLAALRPSAKLPYQDEVDYLQQKILPLMSAGGFYTAPDILNFWAQWLQYGGWWKIDAGLEPPRPDLRDPIRIDPQSIQPLGGGKVNILHLVVYPGLLGDGSGANRPWLQETPDPTTTVMWNSWVEISPELAARLGIKDDDVIRIQSVHGEIEAVAYLYPAIRPDTIAIPYGQGHTALGRYARGRGCNPLQLLKVALNERGDLAYGDTTVTILPTGRQRPLSRFESREGVYGERE